MADIEHLGEGIVGGTVVGGPTPLAAMLAGQYQARAAEQARDAITEQVNNAILALRQNYLGAVQSMRPYTTEGVKALNELNQYMGLGAYNPGPAPKAPEAPVMPTFNDEQARMFAITHAAYAGNQNPHVAGPNGSLNQNRYDPNLPITWMTDAEIQAALPGYTAVFTGGGRPEGYDVPPELIEQARKVMLDRAMPEYNQKKALYDVNYEGYQNDLAAYNEAKNMYDQYTAQGPLTPEQVNAKLASTPGYQFQLGQGADAIQRAAAAKGLLGSGRLLQSLVDYGQGMASTTYGETLSRLAGLVGAGQQSAGQVNNTLMNLGNNTASTNYNYGSEIANSYLAQGNALAQAMQAANQQYKIIGGAKQSKSGSGLGGLGSLLGGAASLLGSGSGGSGLMGLFGG